MLKGIDISSYQNNINSFGNDVDFVICKATEGVGYVDKYCDALYQRAKRDGKLLGVYHFARPDLGNTAEAEAKWFVDNIKGYLNEAILILDWESGDLSNTSYAKRFLDKVYELSGIKPLLYASSSVINSYNFTDIVNADYGLWVAQYGTNNGTAQSIPVVRNWKFYALWQYTSKGRIQGYNADVDMNYFYGDKETWLKYANASSNVESVNPVKKSIDEVAKDVINGYYGNGQERKDKLSADGYNPIDVQNKVNEILNSNNRKSIDEIAREVIDLKWGNGQERYNRLSSAGYNAAEVQNKVNEILGFRNTIKYVVQYGDTLEKIANRYKTTVANLVNKNKIQNQNLIFVGQVLTI